MKDIGDRMKNFYEAPARHELVRRTPVIVRVDGRAFHTFTTHMQKPFDQILMDAMNAGAYAVSQEMQGFKAAYIQSDEASFLLTDYDTLQTSAWFGYVKAKVETICASVMTAAFNGAIAPHTSRPAHFDARAFNIPRAEVANYFLWRANDWNRNSVSMLCSSVYSHRAMYGKGRADQHEMLHEKGLNWADLDDREKNGTWIIGENVLCTIRDNYDEIYAALQPLIDCDQEVECA